jgi:hypothetical protein
MRLGALLPLPIAKEVRALLPAWLVCVVVVAGAGELADQHRTFQTWPLLACLMGSAALGALSVGHEYSHRTLAVLLSQPAGRGRLFLFKQSVLAPMLLILAAVGWTNRSGSGDVPAALIAISLLCGLCVAPWLTMLTRNPLAGTVFAVEIPGFLWLGAQLLFARPQKLPVFWSLMLGVSATAWVLGWRTFMRLEAIEGRGARVLWPLGRTAEVRPARDRHPVWLLVKKELCLQQLSFAVVAFYCASWLVLLVTGFLERTGKIPGGEIFGGMTILYSGMLALLIGALASAEERQLGTLEWQVLLPMASWKQWAVKAGTAIGLSVLLAVGVPALLLFMAGIGGRTNELYAVGVVLLGVVLMTVISLYVSSVCSSGLRAFLASLPVVFVLLFIVVFLTEPLWWSSPLLLAPLAALVALVLWMALQNHRSAERGLRLIPR